MDWQYTPYVLPLLVAAFVSAALALFVWPRRYAPGATPLLLLVSAAGLWGLGNALELGSTALGAKLIWANTEYVGIVTIPVAWLAFALQYTGRERWLRRRNVVLLAIVPILTLLLVWTNDLHGLMRRDIGLDTSGPFSVVAKTYGAWFWVHTAYSYLLLLLGTSVLLLRLFRAQTVYRQQAVALAVSVLMPWIGNMLYILRLSPIPHLDLTPPAFTLSGLALAWGLFRFRLLDLVPVARDAVIEGMSDGVIVLDAQNRIADLNPAAERIVGRTAAEAIGQPADQVLFGRLDLVQRYLDVTEAHAEIELSDAEARYTYDLRVLPLYDRGGGLTGRMGVLSDITERKRAGEALRESEKKYRTLVEQSLQGMVIAQGIPPRLVFANPAIADILGYTVDELLSFSPEDIRALVHPEDQEFFFKRYQDRLQGKPAPARYEVRGMRKDGSVRWLELYSGFSEDGGEPAVQAVFVDISERKRAEGELHRRTEELTALNEIGQVIGSTLNLAQMLKLVAQKTAQACDVERCSILLLDEERRELIPAMSQFASGGADLELWRVFSEETYAGKVDDVAVVREVVRDRRPVALDEESRSRLPERWTEPFGIKSLLLVPLINKEETIGLMALDYTTEGRPFSAEQVSLASTIGSQIGVAIENARLYQEEKRRVSEMEALRQTTLDITAQLEMQQLLHSIVERAAALAGTKGGGLYLYHLQEEGLELVVSHRLDRDYTGTRLKVGEGLSGKVVQTGEPLIVEDYATWEGKSEKYDAAPFRGVMGVPLKWGEKVLGVLNVTDVERPRIFTSRDLRLLELFANQSAVAIENARLYRASQRELAERKRAEEALRKSEERFRGVFENALVGLYRTTPDGRILMANPALVRMLGYSSFEELAQRNLEENGYEPEYPRTAFKERIEAEGQVVGLESAWTRHDGSTLFVRENATAVRDEAGNTVYYEGTVADITERKRAQEELERSFESLHAAFEGTVRALAALVEARDPYTAGHQQGVADLASAIAEEMGLSEEQVRAIHMAGLIHDVGKIQIPAEILGKPGSLTELEMMMIRTHPQAGYEVLRAIEFPWPVAEIVLQHHERMNGSGYPQGLAGGEILMEARILAVADVVEAMASFRPYRPALGIDEALEEIRRNSGILYDAEAVDACVKLFTKEGFELSRHEVEARLGYRVESLIGPGGTENDK